MLECLCGRLSLEQLMLLVQVDPAGGVQCDEKEHQTFLFYRKKIASVGREIPVVVEEQDG